MRIIIDLYVEIVIISTHYRYSGKKAYFTPLHKSKKKRLIELAFAMDDNFI